MRKSPKPPDLRDKLSQNFIRGIESDFAENGPAVIEALRQKSPEKYAEIVSRLIATAEPPRSLSDYSGCESQEDIGKQLLQQMGCDESRITSGMIKQATEANAKLVAELEQIIDVAASVSASLAVHDDVDEGEWVKQ